MAQPEVVVYTDGASRGNPGPAAVAFVIRGDGVAPVDYCDTIGVATNNAAEYTAMIRALEFVGELGISRVRLHSDSELMVRQMRGEYRVKHPDILPLFERAQDLAAEFESLRFEHVPRALNAEADRLCNRALDGTPRPLAAAADEADGDAPAGVLELLKRARDSWSAGQGPTPGELWADLALLLEWEEPKRRPARRRVRR